MLLFLLLLLVLQCVGGVVALLADQRAHHGTPARLPLAACLSYQKHQRSPECLSACLP